MSRKDRQAWQAMLDADPELRSAWDEFHTVLTRIKHPNGTDIEDLRQAADRLLAESGEGKPHH